MPRVSVIVPTYNRCDLLVAALRSVREQTLSDWECIISDDASTDRTQEAVSEFCGNDSRFRYHRAARRQGNTIARAKGCAMARGEFIALLDSDDAWHPRKLQVQVRAFEKSPFAVWSYHGIRLIRGAAVIDVETVHPTTNIATRLVESDFIKHCSVMVKRAAFEALGGYDLGLRLASDWDLLLRLTIRYGPRGLVAIDQVLADYVLHDSNVSSNGAALSRAERRVVRRTVVNCGLILRSPRLAMTMIDRQLGREMYRWAAAGQHGRACCTALLSALARPHRAWRWARVIAFSRRATASLPAEALQHLGCTFPPQRATLPSEQVLATGVENT